MLDLITALPETFTPALLVLSALFAFAESAFGLGVVVPGELAVLVLGAAASTPVQVLLALTVITLAASAADHVGYLLGRRYEIGRASCRERVWISGGDVALREERTTRVGRGDEN